MAKELGFKKVATLFENSDYGKGLADVFIKKAKEFGIEVPISEKFTPKVFRLFPILAERRKQSSKSLRGGEQQMLAISRGLMNAPSLMLLDEPSLGLAPLLIKTIFETLKEINRQGVTLFLVEQNALMALKAANNGYVLEKGSVTLRDKCTNLLINEEIQKSYLGMD